MSDQREEQNSPPEAPDEAERRERALALVLAEAYFEDEDPDLLWAVYCAAVARGDIVITEPE